MLGELLVGDHGQEAGAGPRPWDNVERRGRLADLLAITTGELLPNMDDHLPCPRHDLEGVVGGLTEIAKAITAAALAKGWTGDQNPLPRQMLGKGLTRGALAEERRDGRGLGGGALRSELIFGRRGDKLFELQLHLIQNQPSAPFRLHPVDASLQLLDLELKVENERLAIRVGGP